MAKAPASKPASGEEPAPRKGPSLVVQAGMLVVLSLAAAGMGFFAGGQLGPAAPAKEAAPAAAEGHGAAGAHGGHGEEGSAAHVPGHPVVVPIAPINTNLAAPADIWLRLELALSFAEPPEPGLADSIHQDLLAFVRTLKLHQVQGPSGFMHLRADLDERAKIRSGGKVSRVLIRTLLFE